MTSRSLRLGHLQALLLHIAVLAQHQAPKVTVHFTQTHAYTGDNVTFECRVQNRGGGLVAIAKEVVHLDPELSRGEQVSTNGFLYPNYQTTNRHELRRIATNQVDLYFLHIYNVNHDDTAKYACKVLGTDVTAATEFQVYKVPSEFGFGYHTSNDVIVFEEGKPSPVECHANDVVPLPIMNIRIGSRDLTREFRTDTAIEPQCPRSEETDPGCVLHYAYNKSLFNPSFEPDYGDHGKKLTCEVIVPLAHFSPITTHLLVHVHFSPKFNCATFHRAFTGARNYTMTCLVIANPPLLGGVTLRALSDKIVLRSGISRYGVSFNEQVLSRIERRVSITIREILSKHYGRYILEARNTRGVRSTQLILARVGYGFVSASGSWRQPSLPQLYIIPFIILVGLDTSCIM